MDILKNLKQTIREHKGSSLIDFPTNYVMIDIETTGFDPTYCEIIEISAIKYSSSQQVESFSTLVKPDNQVDDYITNLTGITNEMLENAPDISTSIKNFYDFIGDNILVGYNVNFDVNFLYDNLLKYHNLYLKNSFIDVLRIARRFLPNLENHRKDTVANHYKISNEGSHRATRDCEITNEIFSLLKEDIIQSGVSIEDFKKLYTKNKNSFSSKDISTENSNFDTSHPLYGKTCVFTGTLEKMLRKDAMQLVVDLGGSVGDNVTKKTNFLILGNNDFCKSIKDGKSSKQKKAEALILKGQDLEILSENVFYELVLSEENE